MGTHRTRAYWPTRIILAASIVALPAALFWIDRMTAGLSRPMFTVPAWAGVATIAMQAFAAALWLAGVVWMIRIFRGPNDEPLPWRYRGRMGTHRTRAYWPTRIILAASIGSLPALFLLVAMAPGTIGLDPMSPGRAAHVAILALGVGLWLAGVIWMVRIFRGPGDRPLPWRYRDR